MTALLIASTRPDALTFVWSSVIIIGGALGVVWARNPIHSALYLVMTLLGVAVIFIELQANFLAAVQVIVYAGAIVVLFLFVIMLLGVDQKENLETDPLPAQRPVAIALVLLALAGVLGLGFEAHWNVGAHAVAGPRNQSGGDVAALGRSVFTTYLFAFEVTAALLVIAVVGAVVLSRQHKAQDTLKSETGEPDDDSGDDGSAGPGSDAAVTRTALAEDLERAESASHKEAEEIEEALVVHSSDAGDEVHAAAAAAAATASTHAAASTQADSALTAKPSKSSKTQKEVRA
jgi:NADH-quinone oxidoreductase subunit J